MTTTNLGTVRETLVAGFGAGVDAADPFGAVQRALGNLDIGAYGRVHILSVGKAAIRMAQAAIDTLADQNVSEILVITNPENIAPLPGATVIAGAHPVPDSGSVEAGEAALALANAAQDGDLVLTLISGGASSLMVAPVAGLGLQDKQEVNSALLACGMPIEDMNRVRQALSRIKGGGLARAAQPASIISFVLSDVLGDDLRAVGSGPSVGALGTRAEAHAVVCDHPVYAQLPQKVRNALCLPDDAPLPDAPAHLVGSNSQSLAAMAQHLNAVISPEPLEGDVADAAKRVIAEARMLAPGQILAFGGETTVQLRGDGRGGRNQELALRVALLARDMPGEWVFLSGGTDGRDGPTDAAGGIVDHTTLRRIDGAGIDLSAELARNNSYDVLAVCDGLLMTGGTGTNVADLQAFCRIT